MQMTVSQILEVNGWRTTWAKFYKCPVCKERIMGDAWISPKATRYHPQCVEKAPQVKRLLTKRAPDRAKSAVKKSSSVARRASKGRGG
ncbi:MAG: hypothetical protein U0X74_08650 [Anaerolineales bacterium]